MTPTRVYDAYWKFAAERHAIYLRRLEGAATPWSNNPILQRFRFTNTYRATDRVSQFLIRDVQYRDDRSQSLQEVVFRTLLFKFFNRIETWTLLERELGPLSWQSADMNSICDVLDGALSAGHRIYSAAYIMPSPRFGHDRKHANHLALLKAMMEGGLPARIEQARTLATVYDLLIAYPGLGRFLAFQYAIDLNYSSCLDFSEAEYVVAGPGALDGIAKCFVDTGSQGPEDVIFEMANRQEAEFRRLGIVFGGLFGRPLQPIDCQNLFCEISKYARAAYPEITGPSGRTRIKQSYRSQAEPLVSPFFPPKWGVTAPSRSTSPERGERQFSMAL